MGSVTALVGNATVGQGVRGEEQGQMVLCPLEVIDGHCGHFSMHGRRFKLERSAI